MWIAVFEIVEEVFDAELEEVRLHLDPGDVGMSGKHHLQPRGPAPRGPLNEDHTIASAGCQ